MKYDVLTWTGENLDIPRNPPGDRRVHSVRKADTYPPDGKPVPASARHIAPHTPVAAVGVASAAVRHTAVV